MLKRILLPLDPSNYSKQAIKLACNIAIHHDAELTGIVVLDIPGIEKSIGPIPARASYYAKQLEEAKIKDADLRIHKLLEEFKSICESMNVKYSEAYAQGVPSEMIVEESKYFDLLVMGKRTFFQFEAQDEEGDSFQRILNSSSTPVLAVPKQFDGSNFIQQDTKVLIAVDGTRNASRALHRFAYLMHDGIAEVNLLISNESDEYCNSVLDKSEAYLKAQGFSNIIKHKTTENISDYVDKHFIGKIDLFVIGEHKRNTFSDFFLGSFSRFLIDKSKNLILIGQ